MGSVQPPSMQCAAYNKLGTGVHGFSHVVVGHIGLVVHNNAQHDTQQHSLCPHAATTSLPARSNVVSARTQQHRLCPHAATSSLPARSNTVSPDHPCHARQGHIFQKQIWHHEFTRTRQSSLRHKNEKSCSPPSAGKQSDIAFDTSTVQVLPRWCEHLHKFAI